MLRKWLIVLFWTGVDLGIFALAIASVVYPLLIAAGPKPAAQIATTLLNHALPLSGIKDARARVSDLRIDGAVIEDLRLKDGTTISRIVLSYMPDILTSRNLDHVSVEGVRVSLAQTGVQTGVSSDGGGAEDGWSGDPLTFIGNLLALLDARRGLPVTIRRLDVWGVDVRTTVAGKAVTVAGGMTAQEPLGNAPQVSSAFALSATDPNGHVRAVASLKLDLKTDQDGRGNLTFRLSGGRGAIGEAAVAQLNGTATVALDLSSSATPLAASARIRANAVAWREESWAEARLDLLLTEAGGSAGLFLGDQSGSTVDVATTVDGPALPRPAFTVRWSTDLAPLGRLTALTAADPGPNTDPGPDTDPGPSTKSVSGGVSGRVRGRLPAALLPFDVDAWRGMDWGSGTAQGEVRANAAVSSWTFKAERPLIRGVEGADVDARLALSAARGVLALDLLPGSRLSANAVSVGPAFPDTVSKAVSQNVLLEVSRAGEPPRVTLEWGPRQTVDVVGDISMTSPALEPASLGLSARFARSNPENGADGDPDWLLAIRSLSVRGAGIPAWDEPSLTVTAFSTSGRITPDDVSLSIELDGSAVVSNDELGDVVAEMSLGGEVGIVGERLRFDLDRLAVQPDDGAMVCAEPVTLAGAAAGPAVLAQLQETGVRIESGALALSFPECRINHGEIEYVVSAGLVDLTLSGARSGTGLVSASIDASLRDGRVEMTDPIGIAASGINGVLSGKITPGGFVPSRAEVVARSVGSTDRELFQPTLRIALEAAPTNGVAMTDRLPLSLVIADTRSRFGAEIDGWVDVRDGVSVDLDVEMPPIVVGPEGVPLEELSPRLAALVRGDSDGSANGRLSASGRVLWPDGTLTESEALTIQIEDGRYVSDLAEVDGAMASISFRSVQPPASFKDQPISVDRAIFGVVLRNLEGMFELPGDGGLFVPKVSAGFADGRLIGEAMSWRPGEPFSSVVAAEALDVSVLVPLLELDGLAATGRVSGRVPVTFSPELGFSVEDGVLESVDAGKVQYAPDTPPAGLAESGPQVSLMLQAIENFHYDRLALSLGGRSGTGFSLGAELEGSNPDLYDGYPVELNATLSGQLDEILRNALRAYRIQETIGDRVQEFGLGG